VRWSEFDALVDMIHPDWLAENPVHPVDLDRLHQFRTTEYRVRQVLVDPTNKASNGWFASACIIYTVPANASSIIARSGVTTRTSSAGYCTRGCRIRAN
jgi:hypothetical protein